MRNERVTEVMAVECFINLKPPSKHPEAVFISLCVSITTAGASPNRPRKSHPGLLPPASHFATLPVTKDRVLEPVLSLERDPQSGKAGAREAKVSSWCPGKVAGKPSIDHQRKGEERRRKGTHPFLFASPDAVFNYFKLILKHA